MTPPIRLILLLLLWMLLVTGGCALLFRYLPGTPDARPIRTRPPVSSTSI